jgi:hypothetical protein
MTVLTVEDLKGRKRGYCTIASGRRGEVEAGKKESNEKWGVVKADFELALAAKWQSAKIRSSSSY